MEKYSEQYKARCIKRLNEWGAPLEGWYCVRMYDAAGADEDPQDGALSSYAAFELADPFSQVRQG